MSGHLSEAFIVELSPVSAIFALDFYSSWIDVSALPTTFQKLGAEANPVGDRQGPGLGDCTYQISR